MQDGEGIHTEALEDLECTDSAVREVADALWRVAGACAGDGVAAEALLKVAGYLRALLLCTGEEDPEIAQLGIMEWLCELDSVRDNGDVDQLEKSMRRHPSGWVADGAGGWDPAPERSS